jgi:hypothetical protein
MEDIMTKKNLGTIIGESAQFKYRAELFFFEKDFPAGPLKAEAVFFLGPIEEWIPSTGP